MLRNSRIALIASAATLLTVTGASAQAPKPAPRPLSDAEAGALFVAHLVDSAAANQVFKHHHRVLEMSVLGGSARIETFVMPPNRILTISTMSQLGTSESGYDGTIGWSVSPLTGPVVLEGAPLQALLAQAAPVKTPGLSAQMLGPGMNLFSLGTESIDGRPARSILMVTATGDSGIMYFDAKTGLMAAIRSIRASGITVDTSVIMLFSDYKTVDGTRIATTTTVRVKGKEMVTRILAADHEPFDTSRFSPPKAVRDLVKRP